MRTAMTQIRVPLLSNDSVLKERTYIGVPSLITMRNRPAPDPSLNLYVSK